MRLAISNIAWETTEDTSVAKLLGKFGVDAIDLAPGKYFPDPANTKEESVKNVRQWWAEQGIAITGMQGLLFGTAGLNLFGDRKTQEIMLEHLRAVSRICSGLGAVPLVFGSARNRDRSGLSEDQALEYAVSFFRRLGDVAAEHDVMVCLEPIPSRYGANFMTTSEEAAHVVTTVDHAAIRMQFDAGCLAVNGESPEAVLEKSSALIGHIHASEPDLAPLGDGGTDHQLVHRALQRYLPEHVVTIEMIATNKEPHLLSIERALTFASDCYRTTQETA